MAASNAPNPLVTDAKSEARSAALASLRYSTLSLVIVMCPASRTPSGAGANGPAASGGNAIIRVY
jgi:hypothetical protein